MPTEKIFRLQLLKAIAVVCIVTVHVSMAARETALIVEAVYGSLARCGVPLFLMVTGVLHLSTERTFAGDAWRWMRRLLLPFLTWSVVYALYNYYYTEAESDMGFAEFFVKGIL